MPITKENWAELDRELKKAAKLKAVMEDPAFRAAFSKLDDSLSLRQSVGRDIEAYLNKEGVAIPRGVTFSVKPDNWKICGTFGRHTACVGRTNRKWHASYNYAQ
jgi:hypothetical protein